MYERQNVLRLGFERYESGEWHGKYQPLTDEMITRCLQVVDVSAMDKPSLQQQDVAEQPKGLSLKGLMFVAQYGLKKVRLTVCYWYCTI